MPDSSQLADLLADLLAHVKDLEQRIKELEAWRERADLTARPRPAPAGTIAFPRTKRGRP